MNKEAKQMSAKGKKPRNQEFNLMRNVIRMAILNQAAKNATMGR